MKIIAILIVVTSLAINASAFCAMFVVSDPHNEIRTAVILGIGFLPMLLIPYIFKK